MTHAKTFMATFALLVLTAPLVALDITTRNGRRFDNAEIVKKEPDRIFIMYQGKTRGIATLYYSELTDEWQRHLGYNAEHARQYSEQQRISASGISVILRVSQMLTKDVALCYSYIDGVFCQICVVGPIADHVVDDRVYKATLYRAGRYTFSTVAGAQRTVSMYAIAPEVAQAIIERKRDPIPATVDEVVTSGTGWVTENGCIVTCWHVIEGKGQLWMMSQSLEKTPLVLVTKSATNDLAVLAPKQEVKMPAGIPIARGNPELGETVFTIGYPFLGVLGKEPRVSEGIVSSLSGLRDDPRFLQISVPLQPGNSGGPLLTRSGEVVGVITSKLSALAILAWTGNIPENVNFAVRSTHLADLLRENSRLPEWAPRHSKDTSLSDAVKTVQESIVIVLAE